MKLTILGNRCTGKSTQLNYLLEDAIAKPERTILFLMPNFNRIMRFINNYPSNELIRTTSRTMEFKNGTRIIFASQLTQIIGYHFDDVFIDDREFIDNKLVEAALYDKSIENIFIAGNNFEPDKDSIVYILFAHYGIRCPFPKVNTYEVPSDFTGIVKYTNGRPMFVYPEE